MTMIMVVQGLPIDRGDDREGELVIVGESDFRNGSRYIRLPDSRCYQRTGKGSGRIKGTAVQVYLLNCGSSDNFLIEEEYSDGVIPVTFLNCLEK